MHGDEQLVDELDRLTDPTGPHSRILLPNCSNTGSARLKTCSSPPTITVSVPASAPAGPPETGASRNDAATCAELFRAPPIERDAHRRVIDVQLPVDSGAGQSACTRRGPCPPSASAVRITSDTGGESAGVARRVAPRSMSDSTSALRERLQMETSLPPVASRRPAIGRTHLADADDSDSASWRHHAPRRRARSPGVCRRRCSSGSPREPSDRGCVSNSATMSSLPPAVVTRHVRRDEQVRHVPERIVGRERLGVDDVERCAGDTARRASARTSASWSSVAARPTLISRARRFERPRAPPRRPAQRSPAFFGSTSTA